MPLPKFNFHAGPKRRRSDGGFRKRGKAPVGFPVVGIGDGTRSSRRHAGAALCVAAALAVATALAAAAPAPSGAPATPPQGDRHASADGQALYGMHCEACHGRNGRGDGPDADLSENRPRDLHDGFLARYPDDEIVRRILDGRPLQLTVDPTALRKRIADVEAIAAHLERLPTIDWRVVEHGLEVYVEHCEQCHGAYGRPGAVLPPGVQRPRDLSDPAVRARLDDARLREIVRHGHHGMPALRAQWDDADLRGLTAFVRLLSPGYERYTRYCASCHGDDGRGTGSFADAGVRPTIALDATYFRLHDAEQVRTAVWHMVQREKPSMPHFHSRLSAPQARAIIDYLRRGQR
jgi:mono/diheme cytochrome c family protein